MITLIRDNTIWLIPIISIIITMMVKIASKPTSIKLNYRDFLDFGFDLSITSLILFLSAIAFETPAKTDAIEENSRIATGAVLLFISFVLIMIISVVVGRNGWKTGENEINEPNIWGVVIPDLLGVVLLVLATLYSGGVI